MGGIGSMDEQKKVVYVQKVRKKFQFSKAVTCFLLAMITITWIYGLFIYKDHVEYFSNILNYVQACVTAVMPYFCLSMADRVQYAIQAYSQAKYQKES